MIQAVEPVRKMNGGSQGQLMRASDGYTYVVKFADNPQHCRVLANEWLASNLASQIGLPVPLISKIEVPKYIVDSYDLTHTISGRKVRCRPGIHFGSRLLGRDFREPIYDHLSDAALRQVANLEAFAGILAFDQWTCNCDCRQVLFCRTGRTGKLWAYMVDHGNCFNAGTWTFPDNPLRGIYPQNVVYAGITSWQSFEPWITRIEEITEPGLHAAANEIPTDWHGDLSALRLLLRKLARRRRRIRELIWAVKEATRSPLTNWVAHERGSSS